MNKILRSLRTGIQLYRGNLRYLVLTVLTGGFVYFARPLLSPFFVKKIFDSLTDGDTAAMSSVAAAGFAALLLLIIAGYFLIVYADAWMIYLNTYGCISAYKRIYDRPSAPLWEKFSAKEQFTRVESGGAAASSAVAIVVQCFAMSLSSLFIIISLFRLSSVLFACCLVYMLLEYCGIRLQVRKQYGIQQRLQENLSEFNGSVESVVKNAEQLLFLDECDMAVDAVWAGQDALWKTKTRSVRVSCAFQFYSDFIFAALKVSAFGLLGKSPAGSAGGTGALNTMLDALRDSSGTTIRFASELPDFLAATDRLADLLDFNEEKDSCTEPESSGQAIVLDQVTLVCGSKTILDNVTLSVAKGDKVALTGDNGAGKTTLLQALLGERPAALGKICIFGADVTKLEHEKRMSLIGAIPVDCQLYSVTAAENISMGVPGDEKPWLPAEESFFEQQAGQLSAGQKRRANILRALQKHPAVLFADEPDADLDAQHAAQYMEWIRSKADTVIAITHSLQSMEQFDYILKLENGQLNRYDSSGRPESLRQKPVCRPT